MRSGPLQTWTQKKSLVKGVFHYSNSRNLLNLRNLTDISVDYVKTTSLRQN